MMAELKPYSKYKDSGVEWIGEIPEGWTVMRLKYITEVLTDYTANGSFKGLADNVKYLHYPSYAKLIRLTDLRKGLENNDGIYVDKSSYNYLAKSSLFGGEFLIANVGAYAGHIEKMPYIDMPATLGPNMMMAKFDENKVDNQYMIYAGESTYFRTQLDAKANASSAQPKLNKGDFKSILFLLPTFNEQIKIKEFLDVKMIEIDSLISYKQRLIKLLEEKRQAIITETVTKGLDPNVKMKDSGIEWIGEIPAHWEVMRLKNLLKLNPPKSEVNKEEDVEVTFIPMEKLLSNGEVDYSLSKHISDVYNGYTYFKDNDIIMAKVTPCFENGNIALVKNLKNGVGFGTTELHVLRTNEPIEGSFLYYLLKTEYFKQEGVSTMYGVGGLKRIPARFVLDYKIGLPEKSEQLEILEYIDKIDYETSELINEEYKVIDKLKEYRESLIYEAVTGKIDLRNVERNTSEISFDEYGKVAEEHESYQ